MMLIGGGGNGGAGDGGGSGTVTVWYGAAQHVPDSLSVAVAAGSGGSTRVLYQDSSGFIALLSADSANNAAAGLVMNPNEFTASGFFTSTAGQAGSTSTVAASTTTFLSGGANGAGNSVTANYGYSVPGNGSGFFQMQPIIVGCGGSENGNGGIGCGGGGLITSLGGPGFALIASW